MSSIRGFKYLLSSFLVLILVTRDAYMETVDSVGNGVAKLEDPEQKPDNDKPHAGRMRRLSFKKPNLTEEDERAHHMPLVLKCDGCRIIAFQLTNKFQRQQTKFKDPSKRLSESDIIDIVDGVCEDEFDNYGVKEVNGVKRLSGPGLETADVAGMLQGGSKWPSRLQTMCKEYVGEVEEETIYAVFLSKKPLEDYLCRGEGLLGACHQQTSASTKEQSRAKAEF